MLILPDAPATQWVSRPRGKDAPPADAGGKNPFQLQRDFASSEELFAALKDDSPYWSLDGKSAPALSAEIMERHELGGGVVRIEGKDGRVGISGLTLNGLPITAARHGENTFWEINAGVILQIGKEAMTGSCSCHWNISLPNGQAEISQLEPGARGSQFSMLKLADGRTFKIFSSQPIEESRLHNLARAITENPRGTVPDNLTFVVMEKLGEARGPDGTVKQTGGAAHPEFNAVYLSSDELSTPEDAHMILDHECCGHINDSLWGKNGKSFSQTAVDHRGRPIFGTGHFVPDPERPRWGNKSGSDFIREYSSRNSSEDFADTMALAVGGMKDWGNEKTILTLPRKELMAALKDYSPGLRHKILAVIRKYRQESFASAGLTAE